MESDAIKAVVREQYGKVASEAGSCCAPSCCGGDAKADVVGKFIGYSDEELSAAPEGANLGLGCGNPGAIAAIQEGETVLDLGSGGGFDCFLAAGKVGSAGRVIGVDMTPEMLERARKNAEKGGYTNVEFRQGEIEALPVEDGSVDAILSNCVINLAPDKARVFAEAYRVLKPGGRIAISDIVLLRDLPEAIRASAAAYAGCVAGALKKEDYLGAIAEAGFEDVTVTEEVEYPTQFIRQDPVVQKLEETIAPEDIDAAMASIRSIKVSAVKPVSG